MMHSAMLRKRFFSTFRTLQHDNPLGLPRSGTPPSFPRRRGLPEKRKIRDVKKIIAVSSAKGGVGKSTIAVNLALSFARRGIRTGILDTDIFGPSIPTLLNLSGEPRLDENNCLLPLTNYGLKSMSMGYLLPQPTPSPEDPSTIPMDTTPISWRGLMVTKAMHQLLHSVSWGPLDVLFLDLPPGTGDVQLTIGQEIIVDGAVIVSTPQDIALRDAVRGYGMFQKMDIPVLGMVRNMAFFACPQCGHQTKIFSHGDKIDGSGHSHQAEDWGVVAECKRLGVEFLGDIPLDARVCEDADRGMPTVVAEESQDRSVRRKAFLDVAEKVAGKVGIEW
ncbi:P-loop containing nucleoside triphosphate hydrolase protein [Aspergillus caelatus]|uniref:P-loop containing nucleoside triphosphate hydrolase protein n=3 Tax=Aspergillus subgen. Circumdati TaxID=2720871 RepID=A0A5N7AFG8_9EURO|nr:P-loop containing nucleoside triphosphate hydrolase protein [Aspergillus caelatus]KAE8368611.1 P-loop containing nucleoside triphosphate hydrolase protein [Aspergillus caelatus]KAE8418457.1 P-loop containing nucleoside triphosphate hydrolase protein [Aspergillus pseudocaelatus]